MTKNATMYSAKSMKSHCSQSVAVVLLESYWIIQTYQKAQGDVEMRFFVKSVFRFLLLVNEPFQLAPCTGQRVVQL